MNIFARREEINLTFAKKIEMVSGLKYFLIAAFLLTVCTEVYGSDGREISSGGLFITCIDDTGDRDGKGDFVKDSPVFPFNDMLIVKEDSERFKFRLHTHFLFNHDSHRHVFHSCKLHLGNSDTKGDNIHSTDYYIYTLEKIVI
ncbi:MAG: hypothetical protein LBS79_08495 [Tannerella sp.]|nr:hypothetical protein [Tannerella sp.]